ncbi:MAG: DUF2975 domain-containing protein [Firmicutes bacterium]|nr:DUF2975 domain-containing protein [Bacillota bacterium]
MEQKALSKWLKIIIVGVGICGLVGYFLIIPAFGQSMVRDYPEFSGWYWPWLIFLWGTGIPCYVALFFGWKIAANIGNDRSFSMENAKLLKWISWLAEGDAIYFFIGNIVLWFAGMNHPGVVLAMFLVVFAGVAIAVAAAALSHLVKKAAVLQEESDLTI